MNLHRQAAQNVLEFGLGVAAVAFVALVGFNALGRAQALYWGATEPTLAQPTPGPGAFIHPTSVDAPVCTDNGSAITGPVPAGDTIVCQPPRVRDIYSDPLKRTPPWGYIGLHLDDSLTPLAVCLLPHATAGSTNACSSSLSWTVPATFAGQTHTLSLWYECPPGTSPCNYPPQSNHAPSQSSSLQVSFFPLLQFSTQPTCTNPDSAFPPTQVEIGHPTICTAQIANVSNPAQAANQTLTWTAPMAPNTGTPQLNCFANGATSGSLIGQLLWNSPASPPNCGPASSVQCQTNSSGQCSIVYRRLRDLTGNLLSGPVGSSGLTVSAVGNITATASVTVVAPAMKHPSAVIISCSGQSTDTASIQVRQATFVETARIEHGNNISCSATVIDTDPSPVYDCASQSPWTCSETPDVMDAHSPLGVVTWTLPGVSTSSQCTLNRVGSYNRQAPNQAPFASSCQVPFSTLSDGTLTADYSGPTHSDASSRVDVH